MTIASGATVGNAAISATGTGSVIVQPGSGTISIGSNSAGSSGATLSLGSGTTLSMVDGSAGALNLQQQTGFGASNAALTLAGATLNLDLTSSGADQVLVGVGNASVSGTNTIALSQSGASVVPGTYPLITAPAGGLSGIFQFSNSMNTANLVVGANTYQLTLNNTNNVQSVTIANVNTTRQIPVIQDQFSGTNGASLSGKTPDTVNLPGGTWSVGSGTAKYQSPNELAFTAANGYMEIPTKSGSYTPPSLLTISAALSVGGTNANGDPFSRGMGIGFFAVNASGKVGEFYWAGGMTLDPAGSASALGQVELDQGVGPGNNENRLVLVPYNAAAFGGAAFSTSAFYTLSYTINTSTGQISNVSLSNGTYTDTADYTAIDSYNTSAIFTVANTAYAGIINGSAGNATGYASNFELSTPQPPTTWTGGNSTSNWVDVPNWSGPVPGATSGTTNTDTALFNATVSFTPPGDRLRSPERAEHHVRHG